MKHDGCLFDQHDIDPVTTKESLIESEVDALRKLGVELVPLSEVPFNIFNIKEIMYDEELSFVKIHGRKFLKKCDFETVIAKSKEKKT